MEDFITYFQDTWLLGNFQPSVWNVFETTGPRTNNHLEGWHNRLKIIVGKPHPNVYEIVEVFQKEQLSVEVSLAQLAVRVRPPRRAKKTIEKERKLTELKQRFQDQAISLHDYVAGVSAHSM